MQAHPDLFRVVEQARRLTFGNRREYCPSHPLYHDCTRAIVTAMAEHYTRHPAVVSWQIDNEFGYGLMSYDSTTRPASHT